MKVQGFSAALLLLFIRNIEAICSNTCGGGIYDLTGSFDISYPCPPNNYQNNVNCDYQVSANGSFTQILIKAIYLEPWHDFLKMQGPKNFLMFINATTYELILTGYPAADIFISFYSDSDTTYRGFDTTISSLSEADLLKQYEGYQSEGAVQVLKSPLYISSRTSTGDKLDVMFLNLPNNTKTLADAWVDYAKIVLNSIEINIYDVNDTGFSANWTEIDASSHYDVKITNMSGTIIASERINQNQFSYDGLSSGTEFNFTVEAVNKLNISRMIHGNFTTGFAVPPNFERYGKVGQTYFSVKWDSVNGATGYSVKWKVGNSYLIHYTRNTLTLSGLLPGVNYTIELRGEYETGVSAPTFLHQITVPASVTNLAVNLTTTSVVPIWDQVLGSEYVKINVTYGAHTVASVDIQNDEMGKRIGGLEPVTSYRLYVQSGNEAGLSPAVVLNFTTKMTDSTDLVVDNISSTSFVARWSKIVGAIHYEISVNDTGKLYHNKRKLMNNATQSTFDNLPSGSNFDIELRVFDSKMSSKVIITQANTDMAPPYTDLDMASVTQTTIGISWTPVFGALSYRTNVTSAGDSFNITYVTSPLLIGALDSGTVYEIYVAAIFPVGIIWSNLITQITAPGDVQNLDAHNINVSSFIPTWDSPRGATSYEQVVERKRDGSIISKAYTATSGTPVYGLYPGTLHVVKVKAVNDGGKSSDTLTEFRTELSTPTHVRIVSITKSQFLFIWDKVDEATSYYYHCSNKPGVMETQETSVSVGDLQSSTTYSCSVYATSDDGAKSSKVSAEETTARRECEKDPCLNDGICVELHNGFKCTCAIGFEGTTCEKAIDWCKTKQCADNTDCTNERTRAVCSCSYGFIGDGELRCRAYCDRSNVTVQDEILTFNFTYSGETTYSNENCNGGRSKASAVCKSRVGKKGETISEFPISEIILVRCELRVADVTIKVNETTTDVNAEELETQSAQLQVLTSAAEELTNDEVEKVAEYIKDVGKIAENNKESVTKDVLTGIVNTADNLISSNSIAFEKVAPAPVTSSPGAPPPTTESPQVVEKREKEIKKKILKSLTTIAEQVKIPNDTKEIVIETKSMVVKVFEAPIAEDSGDPDAPSPTSTWFAPIITETDSSTSSDEMRQPMNISIPFTALEEAENVIGRNKAKEAIRLTFFLHKDASLFPSNGTPPEMIIAASLGTGLALDELPEPIRIAYNDLSSKQGISSDNSTDQFHDRLTEYKCVYWNFDTGSWQNDGCCLSMDEFGQPTCQCDHMTNYALLVSKSDIPADVVIEIISDIGCYLSIIALLSTIIVHCMKEEIRKKTPTKLLLQICGCLLVSYLVFVVGIAMTENEASCIAIAALLQYFLLASWCWMVVYASDMYRSFVLVFNASKSRYITKCALFAYGVPLVITIINLTVTVIHIDNNTEQPETLCLDDENYINHAIDSLPVKSSYVAENMCWLHDNSLYFGFLLPVGLMLIFNMFVYSMVMKILMQRGNKLQSSAKRTSVKANLLISITISASTGMTWVFGYLMLLSDDENYLLVTSWIFSLLNTSQGFIIFLTTCVRHENMRKIWWAPIRRSVSRVSGRIQLLSPKRQEFVLTTTSETTSSSATGSKSTQNTRSTGTTAVSFTAKDFASNVDSETAF